MSERIQIEMIGHVAHVKLVRGDKMNALDNDMFEALIDVPEQLKADGNVRAVVLSGEGRAFCAGLDMGNFAKMQSGEERDSGASDGLAPRVYGKANRPQQAVWAWHELPVPVIAAVHGVAFGGGFQLTLGADMRYVHPDTKMSVMEIKWGLVPDMAGTQLMRHFMRDDVIRELTYTGRIFSGAEAADYGLVTRLAEDPLAEALATAEEIASKNPHAIQAAKTLLNQANYAGERDGLMLESELQDTLIGTDAQKETIMAEMQKRPAKYANAR